MTSSKGAPDPLSSDRASPSCSFSTKALSQGTPRRIGDSFHSLGEVTSCESLKISPRMSEEKVREQAWRICRDYLSGPWKAIEADEMIWKPLSGGLSNYLYYCALPPSVRTTETIVLENSMTAADVAAKHRRDPHEVLVRIYGQVQEGEQIDVQSLVTESVIFTVLSERRLGPKLYGVFPGGRLEEYIPSPSLKTWEMYDPEISRRIAEQMARMHTLQLPLSKAPTWIWGIMQKWLLALQKDVLTKEKCPASPAFPEMDPRINDDFFRFIKQINLGSELRWLRQVVEGVRSKVVFGHNDMQEGNILVERLEDGSISRLVIIDFEYCAYNYRGFDLANHFCEWMYNYKEDSFPFFSSDPDNYPTCEAQMHFLRHYVSALVAEQASNSETTLGVGTDYSSKKMSGNGVSSASDDDLQKLFDEVDVFQLASHLFWSLWSCVNATTSNIPFGYWDYAVCRAKAYLAHKKKIEARIAAGELWTASSNGPDVREAGNEPAAETIKSDSTLTESELAAAGALHGSN